jgi:cell division protein FtsW (lipid II flippase)
MLLIHRQTSRSLPDRDPFLLPVAALLSGWGLLAIWRLDTYFGLRQAIWVGVAGVLFLAGLSLPTGISILRRYKYFWLTGGLLLTGLTLLFGTNPTGGDLPKLWLGCCGLYFQPSEPLKILLIIYLAAYLAGSIHENGAVQAQAAPANTSPRLLPLLAPTLIMTGLALLLLVVQRDLGTASIFLFLYTAILYVTSGRKRILVFGGLAVVLAGIAGYALFDVVRLRIDAWLNPWADPSGRSYQIVQSLLAVANGGLVGRGPGLGSPGLVPVPHSDFIFAAIAEETGLLGALGLLLLLALLANRGLHIALSAPDAYRRYLAAGLTAYLVAQSILIIGGNLRLLPLTGVTLPFVSYGGSSLLTSFFSLLILLRISSGQAEARPSPLAISRPYLHLGAFLLAGLAAAALATGWWAYYRGPDLLTRTDNPRRVIADRFVHRGAILDRSNEPLVATQGQPGNFTRQIRYTALSPVIGYTNPIYGQSGLEASLDEYLRGIQGNPGLSLWWNHLLYGQPPPGLDVRLSLDLRLQRAADKALSGRRGALVLLNAQNGEILAMASHPDFDANQLELEWDRLVSDPNTPLLNRATLGRYPAGRLEGLLFPGGPSDLRLNPSPQLRLPVGDLSSEQQGTLILSPLQVALASASLSADGIRPAPVLVTAVNTPQSGWLILPAIEKPVQAVKAEEADRTIEYLAVEDSSLWQSLATAPNGPGQFVTWFAGGTLPEWGGPPLAAAVLLEENDTALAEQIGQGILNEAMQP